MKRPSNQIDEATESNVNKKKQKGVEDETKTLEKQLSQLIRHKKKFSMTKPKLIMTLDQQKVFDKSLEDSEKMEWIMPQFFVQDIQRVILYSVIGNQYRFFPRWCKILRPALIKSVNLITINNVSEYDYQKLSKKFKKFNKIFTNRKNDLNSVEFVSPHANNNTFYNEFVSVPMNKTEWEKLRNEKEFKIKAKKVVDEYRKLFYKLKSDNETRRAAKTTLASTSDLDKISRKSLLLNAVQMIREDYPLPFDVSYENRLCDYVYTKDHYEPVTNASPLYSIDCEMCYNQDGEMEIVWFSMVNENFECVYETFVKPRKQIKDYLTWITSVTHETLTDVKTDLSDVQAKLRQLLPADAILCGQSLNNDLHALKMFHPYIIDTSIIYNLSGNRDIKPSLKRLTAQFLGKMIQEGTHNPTIDAKASLQLVLLKLRNGIDFGDVIINGCTNIYADGQLVDSATMGKFSLDDLDLGDPQAIANFIYETGLNVDQNFFNVLSRFNIPYVYIDRESKKLKNENQQIVTNNEHAFNKLNENLNKHKFTWTQFYIENGDENEQIDVKELKKVLKYIRKVEEQLDNDSMLLVAFTGRKTQDDKPILSEEESIDDVKSLMRGRCFLNINTRDLDKLEDEVFELYQRVYPNGKKDPLSGVALPEDSD